MVSYRRLHMSFNILSLKEGISSNMQWATVITSHNLRKFLSSKLIFGNICNYFGKTCNYELNNVPPYGDEKQDRQHMHSVNKWCFRVTIFQWKLKNTFCVELHVTVKYIQILSCYL
jgi:hypothetical protein